MRGQAVRLPHSGHRRLRDAEPAGHRAARPVGSRGQRVDRRGDQLGDLVVGEPVGGRGEGHTPQRCQAMFDEASAPRGHGGAMAPEHGGDVHIGAAFGTGQHDPGPGAQRVRAIGVARPGQEGRPLISGQREARDGGVSTHGDTTECSGSDWLICPARRQRMPVSKRTVTGVYRPTCTSTSRGAEGRDVPPITSSGCTR